MAQTPKTQKTKPLIKAFTMLKAAKKALVGNECVSDTGVTATFEVITPEMATTYLETNIENQRQISKLVSRRYIHTMKQGNWRLNGEAVKFDNTGKLCDGQHRLSSCIQSNTNFETLVIRGLDPEVFDSLDTGKVRTGGDVLRMLGVKNYFQVSSAVRVWCSLARIPEEGVFWQIRGAALGVDNHAIREQYLSADQGNGQNHWEKAGCFVQASYPRLVRLIGPSLTTFLYQYLTAIDHDKALTYLGALERGIPALIDKDRQRYCPTTLVKEELVDLKIASVKRNHRWVQHKKIYHLFEGWNAFVLDTTLNKLTANVDGPLPFVENSPIEKEQDLFGPI